MFKIPGKPVPTHIISIGNISSISNIPFYTLSSELENYKAACLFR